MKRTTTSFLAIAALAIAALPASANDAMRAVVEPFYSKILSRSSGADVGTAAKSIISVDWKSIGDYSGKEKSRDVFVNQLTGFGKLIPDMTWNIDRNANRPDVRRRRQGKGLGDHVHRHPHDRRWQD